MAGHANDAGRFYGANPVHVRSPASPVRNGAAAPGPSSTATEEDSSKGEDPHGSGGNQEAHGEAVDPVLAIASMVISSWGQEGEKYTADLRNGKEFDEVVNAMFDDGVEVAKIEQLVAAVEPARASQQV